MILKKQFLIGMITLCTCVSSLEAQLPATQRREDLNQLYEVLVKNHPGITRYTTAADLEKLYGRLSALIKGPMTDWEFYRLAARLVSEVKCGHTRLRPSQEMTVAIKRFFPLPVAFAGERMFVRIEDKSVLEVVSINTMTQQALMQKIFEGLPVDGDAGSAKYDFAASSFYLLYARFINNEPDRFNLEVRDLMGKTEQMQVSPGTLNEALKSSFDVSATDEPISFKMKGNVAYLDVNTFSSGEYTSGGYNAFLEKTFHEIRAKGIKNLVVDIRNNGGGDDQYGATLCSYMLQKPFSYFKTVKEKRDGVFQLVAHPCLAVQQPKENSFNGDVVMLVNGRTFSTAADVAAVFKSSKRGVVIGTETGGGYEGNTSGRSQTFTLKNSELLITIPLWYYENAVVPQPSPHRGVIPDKPVAPTPESLGAGIDQVLEAALAALKKNR